VSDLEFSIRRVQPFVLFGTGSDRVLDASVCSRRANNEQNRTDTELANQSMGFYSTDYGFFRCCARMLEFLIAGVSQSSCMKRATFSSYIMVLMYTILKVGACELPSPCSIGPKMLKRCIPPVLRAHRLYHCIH
jgi:hypothetical protein